MLCLQNNRKDQVLSHLPVGSGDLAELCVELPALGWLQVRGIERSRASAASPGDLGDVLLCFPREMGLHIWICCPKAFPAGVFSVCPVLLLSGELGAPGSPADAWPQALKLRLIWEPGMEPCCTRVHAHGEIFRGDETRMFVLKITYELTLLAEPGLSCARCYCWALLRFRWLLWMRWQSVGSLLCCCLCAWCFWGLPRVACSPLSYSCPSADTRRASRGGSGGMDPAGGLVTVSSLHVPLPTLQK